VLPHAVDRCTTTPLGVAMQASASIASGLPQVVEQLLQARAVDVVHLEREHLAAVDDAVDGDDVRMVDARQRARFVQEALAALLRHTERVRQHLQRDVAVELGVARQVDGAHAARPSSRTIS